MLRFSSMGINLKGHKALIVSDIIWLSMVGQSAQQRRQTLLNNG